MALGGGDNGHDNIEVMKGHCEPSHHNVEVMEVHFEPSNASPDEGQMERSAKDCYATIALDYLAYRKQEHLVDLYSFRTWLNGVTALSKATPSQPGRVLDLGCGSGFPLAQICSDKLNLSYTGIDLSSEQIELAKRQHPRLAEQHAFQEVSMIEYLRNSPSHSFEGIVSCWSLYHLPRSVHTQVLTDVYKALVPGGMFLAVLGNDAAFQGSMCDFFGSQVFFSQFSVEFYELAMREIGFEMCVKETFKSVMDAEADKSWLLLWTKPATKA